VRSPWTWKNDATGAAAVGSIAMLRQFEAADRIREVFFRPGSQDAEVKFSVAASDLDIASEKFTLDIDGQSYLYRHGPVIAKQMNWPGPMPGTAAATFEERGGVRSNISATGPWAWFRLLDQAQVRGTDAAYEVTFEKGAHTGRLQLVSASVKNPYGRQLLQQFRCG
jgi:type VI secretion system protein ImpL